MFEVDADIRKAKTLPSEFYTDERFFEISREKIFARAWHFLGRTDEFESLTPTTLLLEFLDEPVLLSRVGEEVICLSNVCTHRGKILVDKPCEANLIRCGYHGRRFSLDGKFLSMPEFEGVEDFPTAADDLKRLSAMEWNGFVFASIDPFAGFAEIIGEVSDSISEFAFPELKLASTKEYIVNAHWALYCENYLESFHLPYVHKSLSAVLDYGTYTTETFRYTSLQTGLGKDGEVAARYVFLFPNLMLNFYPWGISVNVVRPVSSSRCVVEFWTYVADETLHGVGAGADLHNVELEDEAVVESVQNGIRSRFYSHGRYSPTREQGTHHFHRLIAEFMR